MIRRRADEGTPSRDARSRRPGRRDAYAWWEYAIMALVVLAIIVGAVILVRVVTSSLSEDARPASSASADASVTCTAEQWYDSASDACVARAQCTDAQVFDEATNTCALPPPSVTAVTPTSGAPAGGTKLTITGTGFDRGAVVTINGVAGLDTVVKDAGTITTKTPASTVYYPVDIVVTNPDGQTDRLDNVFTYEAPVVQNISEIVPDTGSSQGGEAVIIKGRDFVDGAVVSFYGRPATDVTVLNPTTIRATIPAAPVGPASVNVRNPGEAASTLAGGFTYEDREPRTVTVVRPATGAAAGGTKVTIEGSGFANGAVVTFGGVAATKVKIVSSTKITAVTPAGAAGAVTVTVRNPALPAAILPKAFTYVEAATIDAVKPGKGPLAGGTKVTIRGTGFRDGAVVTFGDATLTDATVVDDTTIRITTPAAAKPGVVTVTVTNPGEPTATLKKAFVYTAAGAEPTPQPTSTEPTTPALPRCRSFTAGPVVGEAGNDLVLDAAALFPASTGVSGATLRVADFQPNSGRADGSILWRASPPIVFWQTPGEPGRGGTIDYFYRATSCTGEGLGTIKVTSR